MEAFRKPTVWQEGRNHWAPQGRAFGCLSETVRTFSFLSMAGLRRFLAEKIGTGADIRAAMVMALASNPGLGHRKEIRSRPHFPPERETYGASTNRRTVSPRFGVQIGFTPVGSGSHRMKIRRGACSK